MLNQRRCYKQDVLLVTTMMTMMTCATLLPFFFLSFLYHFFFICTDRRLMISLVPLRCLHLESYAHLCLDAFLEEAELLVAQPALNALPSARACIVELGLDDARCVSSASLGAGCRGLCEIADRREIPLRRRGRRWLERHGGEQSLYNETRRSSEKEKSKVEEGGASF